MSSALKSSEIPRSVQAAEVYSAPHVLIPGFLKESKCFVYSFSQKPRECPNRCNLNTEHIKPIGKALLRMYNELDVQCVHHDKCNKVLKLVDLEQHEKTCQLPKCDNFELCANLIRDVSCLLCQT